MCHINEMWFLLPIRLSEQEYAFLNVRKCAILRQETLLFSGLIYGIAVTIKIKHDIRAMLLRINFRIPNSVLLNLKVHILLDNADL